MNIGFTELLLILVIVFVLFGAGKLPQVMGDVGKGLRSLRDGLKNEGDKAEAEKPADASKKDDA